MMFCVLGVGRGLELGEEFAANNDYRRMEWAGMDASGGFLGLGVIPIGVQIQNKKVILSKYRKICILMREVLWNAT